MDHNHQKKIAVINDFSGFGRCSIAVALPIISAMRIQCCPLPTAIFSDHTGFDSFYMTDFTAHMEPSADEWAKLDLHFNGIATGFLGSVRQIEIVEHFLRRFDRDDTTVLVDPVMGDYGALYPTYTQELAKNMARLVRYADILTPNLTEACVLTEREYNPLPEESELLAMCRKLCEMGPRKIVISGLDYGNALGNFIYEEGKTQQLLKVPKVGICRSVCLFHQNVGHQGVLDLLGHLALVHALLQGLGQVVLVALSRSGAAGVHQGGVSLGREDLGDTAAHGAGAEDSYFHN